MAELAPVEVRVNVAFPDVAKASIATSALEMADDKPAVPTGGSTKLAVTVTSPEEVTGSARRL